MRVEGDEALGVLMKEHKLQLTQGFPTSKCEDQDTLVPTTREVGIVGLHPGFTVDVLATFSNVGEYLLPYIDTANLTGPPFPASSVLTRRVNLQHMRFFGHHVGP